MHLTIAKLQNQVKDNKERLVKVAESITEHSTKHGNLEKMLKNKIKEDEEAEQKEQEEEKRRREAEKKRREKEKREEQR